MVHPIPHAVGMVLTGAQRVRIERRTFKPDVLVLQVEESYYMATWQASPPSDLAKMRYRWRDAKIEDVSQGVIV